MDGLDGDALADLLVFECVEHLHAHALLHSDDAVRSLLSSAAVGMARATVGMSLALVVSMNLLVTPHSPRLRQNAPCRRRPPPPRPRALHLCSAALRSCDVSLCRLLRCVRVAELCNDTDAAHGRPAAVDPVSEGELLRLPLPPYALPLLRCLFRCLFRGLFLFLSHFVAPAAVSSALCSSVATRTPLRLRRSRKRGRECGSSRGGCRRLCRWPWRHRGRANSALGTLSRSGEGSLRRARHAIAGGAAEGHHLHCFAVLYAEELVAVERDAVRAEYHFLAASALEQLQL
mmetsp:Transcript_24/g.78  ORF Transcript_24/g.78 Transcript_24/m.78 type:complete len:289 (-) Transcript_24:15-881(-)